MEHVKRNGFTIIELIVAIAILSFGIIGIYSAFSFTYSLTQNISAKFTAAYLAQEAFEVVRNIRDENFSNAPVDSWIKDLEICEAGCELDYKTRTSAETFESKMMEYVNSGRYLNIDSEGFYSYVSGTATKFKRKITINQIGSNPAAEQNIVKVTVQITWDYKGKVHSFETIGYLYNWYGES